MGTDIHGWVEIKSWLDGEKWTGILQVWPLLDRDYDTFGSLFGVRNEIGFTPVAPHRELPADMSDEARKDFEAEYEKHSYAIFGATWITWSEIKAIDWDEEPEEQKYYLYRHSKGKNGEFVGLSVQTFDSLEEIAQQPGLDAETREGGHIWKEGEMWEKDGVAYQIERVTRKKAAAFYECWEILFKLMKKVAASSPDEDSRLVVWFDR